MKAHFATVAMIIGFSVPAHAGTGWSTLALGPGVVAEKSSQGVLRIVGQGADKVCGSNISYYDPETGILLPYNSSCKQDYSVSITDYKPLKELAREFETLRRYVETQECSIKAPTIAHSVFRSPASNSTSACDMLIKSSFEEFRKPVKMAGTLADSSTERGRIILRMLGSFDQRKSADKINSQLVALRTSGSKDAVVAVLRDVPVDKEMIPVFRGGQKGQAASKGMDTLAKDSVIEWLGAQVMLDDQLATQLRGLDYAILHPAVWSENTPYIDRILPDGRPWVLSRFESKLEDTFKWCGAGGAVQDDSGRYYCSAPGIDLTATALKKLYAGWVQFLGAAAPDTVRRVVLLAGKKVRTRSALFVDGANGGAADHSVAGLFAAKSLNPIKREVTNPLLRVADYLPGIDIYRWLVVYHSNKSTGAEPFLLALESGDFAKAKAALEIAVTQSQLENEKASAWAHIGAKPADPGDWGWVSEGFGVGHFPPLYVHLQALAAQPR